MKITQVKTAFKIADVKYIPNTTKLDFVYLENLKDENGKSLPQSILKDNLARVYLIVVDGIIKKIGGSQDKGGIKRTLNIYKDGGMNGKPSLRSIGIWYFLFNKIIKKSKVEFYMIYQDNFKKEVKGLFGLHKVLNASISYKIIEECCISDYRVKENNKYPDWNVQEQGMDWPQEVRDLEIQTKNKKSLKSKRKNVNF